MFNIKTKSGCITEMLYNDINFAQPDRMTGSIGFTLKSDDILHQEENIDCELYSDRISEYDFVEVKAGAFMCSDSKNGIYTTYNMKSDGLYIQSHTENKDISQFALNLDLNFLGQKSGMGEYQLLPSSPYMSDDKNYFYYMMMYDCGKCMVVLSEEKCDGWRIKYSSYAYGHYVLRVQIIASFDKIFGGSNAKELKLKIFMADSVDEAFEKISECFDAPLCKNITNGGFDGQAVVEVMGEFDKIELVSPNGKSEMIENFNKRTALNLTEFGLYKVNPYYKNKIGLNSWVWNGVDVREQFDKCTNSIRKPYHNDDNICEGGCFLWAMLANRRITKNTQRDDIIKEELAIIMGENGEPVAHKTIVPYKTDYAPYHICNSTRIQEQYFGVSILLEAYKAYGDDKYLDFAAKALDELLENYFIDGMIYNGQDYTTVCAPVIAIVDMANALRNINKEKAKKYSEAAIKVAEFLIKRDLIFPTEGIEEGDSTREWEDGSVSCTALSVLYVCANIKRDERYIEFAKKVMNVHKSFAIYTPDARMNGSSFRWWETIWEGDGEGPTICAGHAWTIWRAEALYWLGMLTDDEKCLNESWNGFVTNFAKINEKGEMYACFEPDYIRGGGIDSVKCGLKQLSDGRVIERFKIAHCYPKHIDNSLSRYAWVRYCYTWGKDL